jgi:hypothetical protein
MTPNATIDELIARSGAQPVSELQRLSRPDLWDSDQDVNDFIVMTLAERERDR